MVIDRSEGWDGVAKKFIAVRSQVGVKLIRSWARDNLLPSSSVVDVGCGSGVPIAQALVQDGFIVSGIDASPLLIAAFHRVLSDTQIACEAAQNSSFFHQTFAAAVSIGLLFLLQEDEQHQVIRGVANALEPGGRFLFSAPRQACEWRDTLTGQQSRSLGEREYERLLAASGMHLLDCRVDEGGNNYFDAAKQPLT